MPFQREKPEEALNAITAALPNLTKELQQISETSE